MSPVTPLSTLHSFVYVKSMLSGFSLIKLCIAPVSLKVRIDRKEPSGLTNADVLQYGTNKGCTGNVVSTVLSAMLQDRWISEDVVALTDFDLSVLSFSFCFSFQHSLIV